MIILADLIWLLHILLIIFIIVVPFLPNIKWPILILHVAGVLSLLTHWILNNDSCALTLLECFLRGLDGDNCKKNSFMYQLIAPVYNIPENDLKPIIFWGTIFLGVVSFSRLYKNWDKIKTEMLFMYQQVCENKEESFRKKDFIMV